MIKGIALLGLLIISSYSYGQSSFSTIDKNSQTIPDSLVTYAEIADYLTRDLTIDKERARALYIWISHNIHYDLSQINSNRRYNSTTEIITEALKTKKGVCQHYSELFLAMSKSVGLASYLISGYTRDSFGEISELSHAWNAVLIDSNYYLIDATWAAGYELNGKYVHNFRDEYFLIRPKDFIKDHMPFDPMWQFLDNPLDNNDFISYNFAKLDEKGNFAYRDSIQQFADYAKLTQLEKSNSRILASGVKNKLIQKQLNENFLEIVNIKYNLAIDTLNYGINLYNLYIDHKNRQFRKPKIEDSRVKALIENAGSGLNSADKIFQELFSPDKELGDLIIDARNRMPELISAFEKEKDFVDRYLKRWKPLRLFMFLTYGS